MTFCQRNQKKPRNRVGAPILSINSIVKSSITWHIYIYRELTVNGISAYAL